jgi:hypothetical protein
MKTALIAALSIMFLAVAVLATEASAGDVRVSYLDGGASATAITPKQVYTVQCTNPSCYKTSTDGGAPDCNNDYKLPQTAPIAGATLYERKFESASDSWVHVRAIDGGLPGCNLYRNTLNPPR